MRIFVIILITIFLFSCKVHKRTPENKHSLKERYNFLLKREEIGENPLVIVNDSFTSYSSIDLLKYRNINFKEIRSLKKGSNFYIMKFGTQAKDGVLVINNSSFLDLDSETFYLINGNVVDSFNRKSFNTKRIKSLQRVGPIKDLNNKYIILYTMILKDK
ncbi:hypothetical protein Lacal_1404 [Lacinutrix sp. 5H-3-7-4]|nr:hypothetical protein Lacal_1404 [Lacinutrix sp. 5H-3-7-4]